MGRKKGEELRRADDAKRLLDNPLFKEAFATIREELIKHLLNTRVAEELERDRLYITIKALDLVQQHIQSVLETGKLAENEQEKFIN
ncbi:uncharacterized protein METZ01_LOCUS307250 [marine metagenome]|uniref:Uncharacterized protein n=1 Tax=marine metagenome TaxID=408172 RepID=A0A382N057_9ZZZZ